MFNACASKINVMKWYSLVLVFYNASYNICVQYFLLRAADYFIMYESKKLASLVNRSPYRRIKEKFCSFK